MVLHQNSQRPVTAFPETPPWSAETPSTKLIVGRGRHDEVVRLCSHSPHHHQRFPKIRLGFRKEHVSRHEHLPFSTVLQVTRSPSRGGINTGIGALPATVEDPLRRVPLLQKGFGRDASPVQAKCRPRCSAREVRF